MLRALVSKLMQRNSLPEPQDEPTAQHPDCFLPFARGLDEGVYRLVWCIPHYQNLLLGAREYFSLSTTDDGSAVVHKLRREDRFTYHADARDGIIMSEPLEELPPSTILRPFGFERDETFGYAGTLVYIGGLELVVGWHNSSEKHG